MRLTVKTTDSLTLPPGKSDHIEFDDDVPGFGLRLREGGSRTWIYQYRIGSKQRRMALGSAKSVPLSLARENASKLEAKVRLGGDPAMEKQTARLDADNTFVLLAEQYLEARSVGDQIDSEFALWGFYSRVGFALRRPESLCVQLEVLDHCFHGTLHYVPTRRGNPVIIDDDRPLPRLLQGQLNEYWEVPGAFTEHR
jgi:Arm domain-containing DNA-binding protein